MNISLEHQVDMTLGRRADKIDGFERNEIGELTGFADLLQYSSIRLNFNIGSSSKVQNRFIGSIHWKMCWQIYPTLRKNRI